METVNECRELLQIVDRTLDDYERTRDRATAAEATRTLKTVSTLMRQLSSSQSFATELGQLSAKMKEVLTRMKQLNQQATSSTSSPVKQQQQPTWTAAVAPQPPAAATTTTSGSAPGGSRPDVATTAVQSDGQHSSRPVNVPVPAAAAAAAEPSITSMTSSSPSRKTLFPAATVHPLCGWLFKQGDKGLVKTFKKRWFQQKLSRLYYYKAEFDNTPINFIDLKQALPMEPPDGLRFQLKMKAEAGGRVYQLRAQTEADADYWIEGLSAAIERYSQQARASMALAASGATDAAATALSATGPSASGPWIHGEPVKIIEAGTVDVEQEERERLKRLAEKQKQLDDGEAAAASVIKREQDAAAAAEAKKKRMEEEEEKEKAAAAAAARRQKEKEDQEQQEAKLNMERRHQRKQQEEQEDAKRKKQEQQEKEKLASVKQADEHRNITIEIGSNEPTLATTKSSSSSSSSIVVDGEPTMVNENDKSMDGPPPPSSSASQPALSPQQPAVERKPTSSSFVSSAAASFASPVSRMFGVFKSSPPTTSMETGSNGRGDELSMVSASQSSTPLAVSSVGVTTAAAITLEQLKQIENERDECISRINNLQAQLNVEEKNKLELQKKILDLEQKNRDLVDSNAKFEREHRQYQEKCLLAEKEVEKIKNETKSSREDAKKIKETFERIHIDCLKAERENEGLKSKVLELTRANKQATAQVTILSTNLGEAKKMANDSASVCGQLSAVLREHGLSMTGDPQQQPWAVGKKKPQKLKKMDLLTSQLYKLQESSAAHQSHNQFLTLELASLRQFQDQLMEQHDGVVRQLTVQLAQLREQYQQLRAGCIAADEKSYVEQLEVQAALLKKELFFALGAGQKLQLALAGDSSNLNISDLYEEARLQHVEPQNYPSFIQSKIARPRLHAVDSERVLF